MWPLLVSIPPSNRPFPARKPLNMEALKLQVNLIELRLTLIYLEEVLAHICCSCFYYFIIECIPTKESLDIHCWWPAATLCRIGVFFFFLTSCHCTGLREPLLKWRPKSGPHTQTSSWIIPRAEGTSCLHKAGRTVLLVTVQTVQVTVAHTAGTVRWVPTRAGVDVPCPSSLRIP